MRYFGWLVRGIKVIKYKSEIPWVCDEKNKLSVELDEKEKGNKKQIHEYDGNG